MEEKEEKVTNEDSNEFVKEVKTKNTWKVVLVVAILLILLGGGLAYYFYFYNNTNKYIDKISNDAADFLNNELNFNKEKEIANNDLELKGNIDIENIGKFNLDTRFSTQNNVMNITLGNEQLNATIYKELAKLYLEVPEIYDGILELPVEEEGIDLSVLNLDYASIKDTILGYVKYGFMALKEGNNTTKINGLMEKQYIIELDETSAAQANAKFQKLVGEDEKINDVLGVTDANFQLFSEFKLVITVNPFNNKIKGLTYTNADGEKLELVEEKDKYILKDGSNDQMEIYTYDDGFKVVYNIDDINFQLSSTRKNFDLSVQSANDFAFDITLKEVSDKETEFNITFNAKAEKMTWTIAGTTEEISNKENKITLNSKIEADGESLNVNLDLNILFDNNLVKTVDQSKVKKLEDLTEEEQFTIYGKLTSILETFNFGDDIL